MGRAMEDVFEEVNQDYSDKDIERIGLKEKLSYGSGDFAFQLTWSLTTAFLLYFYTDVALVPVAATGTIFLVARILSGAYNPIMGAILDRTTSKHGKARPYFLYMAIPYGILCVLTFSAFDMSDGLKIAYAWVTFLLFGILFASMNSPYTSLLPMMTRDPNNKVSLSSFRTVGMAIGAIVVNSLTNPFIAWAGQGDEKLGFRLVSIVYALIGIACMYLIFVNCKERYSKPVTKENRTKFWEDFKLAFKNKPWVILFVFVMFNLMRVGIVTSITVYFALNVLQNPTMIPILLTMFSIGTLTAGFIAPTIFKKLSYRAGITIVLSGSIAGYCILPFFQDQMISFLVIYMIIQILAFIPTPAMFAMIADTIDYSEWKFNRRMEGFLSSTMSLGTTVGSAIGVAIVGYSLTIIGYIPGQVTDSVVNGLQTLYYAGPISIMIIQIVIIYFYNLDKKQHEVIVQEIRNR